MTTESGCTLTVRGVSVVCPSGSIVGDFYVTETEAKAKGESYSIITGDPVKDSAARDSLFDRFNKARTAQRNANVAVAHTASGGGCTNGTVATGQYTASNFDNPQPVIAYSVDYYVSGANCDSIGVTSSETHFVNANNSNAYLWYTAFNQQPATDYPNAYYPGCPTNIPHSSVYPNTMYGSTGYAFTDYIQSSCGPTFHKAYGYATLS